MKDKKINNGSTPYFVKAYEKELMNDAAGCGIIDNSIHIQNRSTQDTKQLNLGFSDNNRYLVAMEDSGILRRWELETGNLVSSINCMKQDIKIYSNEGSLVLDVEGLTGSVGRSGSSIANEINSFSLSRDGSKFVLVLDSYNLGVFQTETGMLTGKIISYKEIISELINSEARLERYKDIDILLGTYITGNNKYIVTFMDDNTGILIDLEKLTPVSIFNQDNAGYINSLNTDIMYICYSFGKDAYKEIYLKKQSEIIQKINYDIGYKVCLSSDNKYLISTLESADSISEREIVIWDIEKARITGAIKDISSSVSNIKVSKDNKYIIIGSHDGSLKIFDMQRLNPIQDIKVFNNSEASIIKVSVDMKYILTCKGRHLIVWKNENA